MCTHIFQVFCVGKAVQACPWSAIQLVVLVVQHCKVPVLRRHVRKHSGVPLSLQTLLGWQARQSLCSTTVWPSNDKEQKVRLKHQDSSSEHEQKHIGAADQPYQKP